MSRDYDRDEYDDRDDNRGGENYPLHPGWLEVESGMRMFKLYSMIFFGLLGLNLLSNAVIVATGPERGTILFAMVGLLLLVALAALVVFIIGLVKIGSMPEDRDGGAGKSQARTALILTLVSIPTAFCLVGLFVLLAVPFILTAFFREMSRPLRARNVAAAAGTFQLSVIVAIAVSILIVAPLNFAGGEIAALLGALISAGVWAWVNISFMTTATAAELAIQKAADRYGVER